MTSVIRKESFFIVTCAGCLLAGGWWLLRTLSMKSARELEEKLQNEIKSERMGRIRAEQANKQLQLELSQRSSLSDESLGKWCLPLKPIGFITSCFTTRNGTPRQPQLVHAARCALTLASDVHTSSLEGLEQYSHCWIIYIFHENTDITKTLTDRSSKHSKIAVPRLNGKKMGVLATRSPHRPVPIGLSTAQIIGVEGNRLILGGADIVDGSPVLDIKPYVPFCDSLPNSTAPPWVAAEAEDEPLKVDEVIFTSSAMDEITQSWSSKKKRSEGRSLYSSPQEFVGLIKQVLSLDIRSLHKRTGGKGKEQQDVFHVLLESVDVSYRYLESSEPRRAGESGISIVVEGAKLGGSGGRALMQDEEASSHI